MGQHETTGKNGEGNFALARTSTGPRTARGKERSKRNALKHGIFSKVAVLPGESQGEFDSLLEGLRGHFQPVGPYESTRVEILAVTQWRYRRLLIAEGAEIRAASEFVEHDEKRRQFEEATEILSSCPSGLVRKITNPEVLERCLDLLNELKDAVQQDDFNPEDDEIVLTILYGPSEEEDRKHTLFDSYLRLSMAASVTDDLREEGKFLSPEAYKKTFLDELSDEIKWLQDYKKEQTSVQSKRMKLKSQSVPDLSKMGQLLKYQIILERSMERTLSQLDRAQRTRLGQPVAPRIDVNLSSS